MEAIQETRDLTTPVISGDSGGCRCPYIALHVESSISLSASLPTEMRGLRYVSLNPTLQHHVKSR